MKNTGAVRKFKPLNVPKKLIDIVLESGIWGPSILAIQPWEFIVISNKEIIVKVGHLLRQKADSLPDVPGKVALITSRVIENAPVIIAVYNTRKVENRAARYGNIFIEHARAAELQAIGAAIQNMILAASSVGLGSVWLDAPTFFKDEINKIVATNNELIAFLVLGLPDQDTHRSKRLIDVNRVEWVK